MCGGVVRLALPILAVLVVLDAGLGNPEPKIGSPIDPVDDKAPVVAEDESCNTASSSFDDSEESPSDWAPDMPIIRAIRQISFPGQGGSGRRPQGGGLRPGHLQEDGRRLGVQQPSATGGGVVGGSCPGNCVPIVACSFQLSQVQQTCQLPDTQLGVCCPPQAPQQVGKGDNRLFTLRRQEVSMQPLSSEQVNSACQKGVNAVSQIGALENQLISANQILQQGTPAYGHSHFFKVTPTARQAHEAALQVNQASRAMLSDNNLSPAQGTHGLRQFPVRDTILAQNCPVAPSCNQAAKYRTTDGTCNNLQNPLYGKSETAFQRIVPPVYDDGVSSPRTRSAAGQTLPSERVIASNVLVDRNDEHEQLTVSVMQWAQFIDHDLTLAAFSRLPNNEGIQCCPNGTEDTSPTRHPECWPIRIPQDDPFYAPKGRFCMNFIRTMLGLNQECTFGYAEQMNQNTHWLDGSQIYGSTETVSNRLRQRQGGLLLVSANNMLPFDETSGGFCQARSRGARCYFTGDSRVNQQPGLTAIHTLFHREHNRVARALGQLNPSWSDEAIYQEARRIVVGGMQHIVYNEWLPIIVGANFMNTFGINPQLRDYSYDYSFTINANINNEFAASAFRFGHSLVQGVMQLFDANGRVSTLPLREHFNSPHILQSQPGVLDMFSRHFARQPIQKFDSFVTDDLSNHLFQTPTTNFGMDLMSLNLHRGRDHGIAGYNAIREICGLPRARSFQDFNDQIPLDIIGRLSQVYSHVDDVDFFVGGMSEKPVSGGLLGWTFLCVVGDQFARLKKGDRFFYDIGGQPGSFNPRQLTEIRKASWARILCDNSDALGSVQPLAFHRVNNNFNRVTPCQGGVIPQVDLSAWQGEQAQA